MIVIKGEPKAKLRPRVGKGRVYSPDSAVEQATAWEMKAQWSRPAWESEVWVIVNFYLSPSRKVDIDNLLKHVFDAGNNVLWTDDRLIRMVSAAMVDSPEPRTEISIRPARPAQFPGQVASGQV